MTGSSKLTLVLGASSNPGKVSYEGLVALSSRNFPAIGLGRKEYYGHNFIIYKELPPGIKSVHTISLYIGEAIQPEFYDLIFTLSPERIIFNPGTSNPELEDMAVINGIEVVKGCMLTMLQLGEF